MKTLKTFIFIAAFSMCAAAQSDKLSVNEITKITNAAYALQRSVAHRVTYSSKEWSKIDSKETLVSFTDNNERLPDGSFRSKRRTTIGKEVTTIEKVSVGGRRFTKTNDQPWVEEMGSMNGSGIGGEQGTTREHKYATTVKRNERINNIVVDLFQVTRHFAFDQTTGSSSVHDSTSSYWIDKSGRLIRTEITRKKKTGKDLEEVNSIWDFEYDPSIKIEAPIK